MQKTLLGAIIDISRVRDIGLINKVSVDSSTKGYLVEVKDERFVIEADNIFDAEEKFQVFASDNDEWAEEDWNDFQTDTLSSEEIALLAQDERVKFLD